MKKLVLSIGTVFFIALAAVNVHFNMNNKSVSSLALANIKALSSEGDTNPNSYLGGYYVQHEACSNDSIKCYRMII
ncbi:hypothetical protein FACS189464_0930 [Bacteroidia bacterium]|nr:hypothetical protein FACS189464_0930 [Bacteroidia bacterium]